MNIEDENDPMTPLGAKAAGELQAGLPATVNGNGVGHSGDELQGGEPGSVDEPPRDIDRHTFAVTFFPDIAAKTIIAIVNPTLPQLAEAIRRTTDVDKMALPWLKMATFGDERSKYGCLRTNKNLIEISGVEGDHDSGELPFDAAVEIMRKARIRCLLYTSASFVPVTKERWRILVPLSKPYPPSSRRELVAEINGLLGGVLAGESFTLSLSYLFGSVNNNPDHRVEVIDGMFLDQCPGLLPGAIFKDGSKGFEGLTGEKPRHRASVNHAPPKPVERSKVKAALEVVSSNCKYEVWLKIAGALYHQFGDDGFELFDDWSIKADGFFAKSDGTPMYTSEKTEARWNGARTMTDITLGTLLRRQGRPDVAQALRGRGTATGLGGRGGRYPYHEQCGDRCGRQQRRWCWRRGFKRPGRGIPAHPIGHALRMDRARRHYATGLALRTPAGQEVRHRHRGPGRAR
jgi:Primase C terminal 2 (PriCT-2)